MANILENKTQLAVNNTSLREQVLSMVRDLPEAGGGGEDITAETNEYTSLLSEALTEIQGKAALGGDATADDIREGKTAYVNGQLLEGLMKSGLDLSKFAGYTKMAVDYEILPSDGSGTRTFYHSLGEIPKLSMVFALGKVGTSGIPIGVAYHVGSNLTNQEGFQLYWWNGSHWTANINTNLYQSATEVKFGNITSYKYTAGVEYMLLTFA